MLQNSLPEKGELLTFYWVQKCRGMRNKTINSSNKTYTIGN